MCHRPRVPKRHSICRRLAGNGGGGKRRAASGAGKASQAGSALRTAKANTSSPINDEQRSLGPDSRALNREAPARYSEFPPPLPESKSPSTKKTSAIHFDRRDCLDRKSPLSRRHPLFEKHRGKAKLHRRWRRFDEFIAMLKWSCTTNPGVRFQCRSAGFATGPITPSIPP